jgi:hypothetical protein
MYTFAFESGKGVGEKKNLHAFLLFGGSLEKDFLVKSLNERGKEEDEKEEFGNDIGKEPQWLWRLNNDNLGCKKITP